jgi:hypothetical protein
MPSWKSHIGPGDMAGLAEMPNTQTRAELSIVADRQLDGLRVTKLSFVMSAKAATQSSLRLVEHIGSEADRHEECILLI